MEVEEMKNKENKGRISQDTAAFLVAAARKDIELFSDYLLSMGYQYDGFPKGKMYGVNWIYVNINSKKLHWGMPGIPITEEIGHHAITIEEFLTIHNIFEKYSDLPPLVFIKEGAECND